MTREVSMLKGCILVVEDDPTIATVVAETLSAEGYEVVCAGAVGALRLTVPW
jgi:DNA-binding response OmpR family regulator